MSWKDTKIVRYFIESKQELKKVTWPSRKDTITYTVIVIMVSLGVAAFLGGVDFLLSTGLQKILNR